MTTRHLLLAILVLALALPAFGQSDIGFKGVGGRLAFVDPEGPWDGTVGIGFVTDLGTIVPQLHWDASILYWHADHGAFDADLGLRDVGFRTSVAYHFIEGPWEPYAGGGVGIHFYHFSHDYHRNYHGVYYLDTYDRDDTEFGIQLLGGVQHTFSPRWKDSAEIEFDLADIDQTLLQFTVIYMLGK